MSEKKIEVKDKGTKTKKMHNENKNVGIVKFFKETMVELKKVIWPTKKQLTTNTVVVILASIIMALLLFGLDSGLNYGAVEFFGLR